MTCVICRVGTIALGLTSLTVERGRLILVIKNIPTRVCGACGEAYFDEATTARIEAIAHRVEQAGVELAVQEYAAA